MVFKLEPVQLKHELAVRDELFIVWAPVIATAAEQTLIPTAARFDIGYGDERLGTHHSSVSTSDADPQSQRAETFRIVG